MSSDQLPEIPKPVKREESPSPDHSGRLDRFGSQLRGVGLAGTVGVLLVVSILLGWAVGSWVDSRLGTGQTCMAIGVVVGSAAGFVEMFRVVLKASGK